MPREGKKREEREKRLAAEKPSKQAYKKGPRLRGSPRDEEDVRISKTLSWVLRHGAKTEGVAMRADGYVRVRDLVSYFEGLAVCTVMLRTATAGATSISGCKLPDVRTNRSVRCEGTVSSIIRD